MPDGTQWVVGIHAVTELLKRQPASVERLLVLQGRHDARMESVLSLAQAAGVQVETVPRQVLDQTPGGVHQGVAARCSAAESDKDEAYLTQLLDGLDHDPLLLVLDEVTDPHNMGACLRTADAAGVDAVIVPRNNSAGLNPTVRKVASGAAEAVPLVTVTNLSRTLKALQQRGVWLVGTSDDVPVSLYQQDLTGPLALVMGSEGKGMRRLTRDCCDFLVAIPMAGSVSSLNVSVAAGVCLFEAVRQRQAGRVR
ncbi:MAG: hypothetical protein RLZZ385_1146 [Pseudomonadota bacterium]|jgi:23S rRNA (guanosine2251-2'-O)-methyltransferase